MKTNERLMALTIEQRHVDTKETHKAIGGILDSRRLAPGGPEHPLANGNLLKRLQIYRLYRIQDGPRDTRCFAKDLAQIASIPDTVPVMIEEYDRLWRDQLLKRPAARDPPTRGQSFLVEFPIAVFEEGIADLRTCVPWEHGIDGLGEFGAAGLVDAAGIDPGVLDAFGQRSLTCLFDLVPASP